MNSRNQSNKTRNVLEKETPEGVSASISMALYYLEEEAKNVGMRKLAAQIHLAAVEAEIIAEEFGRIRN